MMARSANAPPKGRIQKRKTNDLQIITSDLQRTAGPYRCANSVLTRRSKKSTDHRLAGAIDVTAQAVARIEKSFVNSMWKP